MVAYVENMQVLKIAQGKKAVGKVTRCACPGGLGRGWVSLVCTEQNSSLRPVMGVNCEVELASKCSVGFGF